ncbi:DUF4270 family protein [Flavobacterium algicola]|uniref:DUF4270 family protein n=1 Tax=Flavobacterium algicola TaxID=556529 RepID=UPI001EFEB12F|nr:DUF4270 family protein [Flavobacterium algicola]MCG9791483.1 DUF4270 domain-containing protein [Flavobacterium algicola]
MSIFIYSCDSDIDTGNFVVGSDYLEINNNVILVDTLAVDVSTVQLDSLVTSSQLRITVGSYTDPIFGKVEASSYFQLTGDSYTIASSSDTEASAYVFDSIRMVMKLDKYYYGDTTQVHSFSIHRLQQNVKTSLEDDTFHNDSSLLYDSQSLGTVSYKPKPYSQDSVNVVLSNDFGNALFQKFKGKEITNSDEFIEYFKGFVIKPITGSSSSVMGFSMSSEMRLYYSKASTESESSLTLTFGINDTSKQFNNYTLDKSGTILKDLPTNSELKLASTSTGNKGYVQSGTGVACRIDVPNIKQLKRLYTNGVILSAQLNIKPANGTYSDTYPLPDSLQVFVCDNLNRIKYALTSSSGSTLYAILNTQKDEFNETIGYDLSLGTFLQSELIKENNDKLSLLLVAPTINKGVNRLVLADQKTTVNKLKLKLYYISY